MDKYLKFGKTVSYYYMHLHYLQQLCTYLFCVLYHHSFHLSLESRVTVKVSSLPPQTTTDEIEAYFEKQGDSIEVLSTVNLGNGNAKVELSGINSEGIHYITHSGYEMHGQCS